MKKRQKRAPDASGQLRIIGGQWRGRKLQFPAREGLRPTGDRIRETLFNWLQGELPDARCLDLFAGAGALGLEALSRGAAHCTLIEKDAPAAQQLRANIALLQAQNGAVEQADALAWLTQYRGPAFDLVFIDPPFAADLWQATFALLEQRALLSSSSWIYVESPAQLAPPAPANWQSHREKIAGEVCYRLYRRL